jgi:Skp family chaperone for outer membrane proteins
MAEEAATIATVNYQLLMSSSTAAKSAHEQIETKMKSMQSEIGKKDETFQKEHQDLEKQRSVLSKDAFEQKKRGFTDKVTSAQKEVQSKRAMLDGASERAGNEIQKAITDIIAEMAKEKGFAVALPTSQILYADSKLDITNEVLEKLNKKLPKVDVKFEAAAKK